MCCQLLKLDWLLPRCLAAFQKIRLPFFSFFAAFPHFPCSESDCPCLSYRIVGLSEVTHTAIRRSALVQLATLPLIYTLPRVRFLSFCTLYTTILTTIWVSSLVNMLKFEEVAKHNNAESCWVIVHGNAYDVTEFLPEHPGGSKIILKYAGKDATEEYDPIHPPGTLEENLPKEKCLGAVDPSTIPKEEPKEESQQVAKKDDGGIPPLSQCLNLYDFEVIAKNVLKPTAWAYYSSGADDEVTMRKTLRRLVESGSALVSCVMLARSITPPLCLVRNRLCPSTSLRRRSVNSVTPTERRT